MANPSTGVKHSSLSKRWALSVPAGLIIVLVVLDFWLLLAHPLARVSTPGLDRGELFNALSTFKKEDKAPDMVLLGSSLVTAPVVQAETLFLNREIPRFLYRRSTFLEEKLAKRLGREPSVFCFAIGGEMVSDAYLITRHVLTGSMKPETIVYGIAPRDFQDNLLPGIEASETFKHLADFEDLSTALNSKDMSWEQKADLCMERVWAFWRYRADINRYLTLRSKKLMEKTMPWVMFEKYGPDLVLRPQKKGVFPEEAKGTLKAYPGIPLEHKNADETRLEYIRRYNPLAPRLNEVEFSYLEKLLALCRERNIKVLLVNMPISSFNKSLIPSGFYNDYLNRAGSLASRYDAEMIDMNSSAWVALDNFVDTVHLKPSYSKAFLSELAYRISRSRVAASLAGNHV